jgi:hypothetical protein
VELVEKITTLPPERIAEAENFVDFLLVRERVRCLPSAKRGSAIGVTPGC